MTADGQKGYNKTGANEQTYTTAYLITFNVTVSSSKKRVLTGSQRTY